ncbi:MAG: urease accessory protein UreE, partial [Xanthobacteraceae bacterium]
LGAELCAVEAPFEPERGAYEHHAHGNAAHHHGHDHGE